MRKISRRGASTPFFVLLTLVLAGIAVTFGILYFQNANSLKEAKDDSARIVTQLTGTDRPLPKTLDPRFKDADGDLVADSPTNPAQLIDPAVLYFSFIAEDVVETRAVWKDFMDHLAKVTGKKVEFLPVPTSNDHVRALIDGKLHITGLNTGTVPMAVNMAGFVPLFALGTPDAGGFLHSDLIVPADSAIKTPADLKGHTVAFTELNSNSGCKAPMVDLKNKFGLLPEKDYTIIYSYGHDRSIAGIADGSYEAAAVASDILERAAAAGKIDLKKYRTIHESDPFPAVTIGCVYNLQPVLAAKIKEAFTSFKFKGTTVDAHYAPSKQNAFHSISYKDDYKPVRYVDDQIGKPYMLP